MVNPDFTHLALIVDRSGSMITIAEDMEGAIRALLEEQAALPGKLVVDVTLFDDRIEQYRNQQPQDVDVKCKPRGSTALNDAMGITISSLGERLAAMPEEERPGTVLVVVVTDGHENASQEWTADAVKKLVTQQRESYAWEFVFLGANMDSFSVAGGYGIRRGQTINYAPTASGVAFGMGVTSSLLRSARAGGQAAFTDADRKAAGA